MDMSKEYEKLLRCYQSLREKVKFEPKVAIVLGSGLGNFADSIQIEAELPYGDIEDFPVSTVPGHAGRFIFGYLGNVPVVCMKGLSHRGCGSSGSSDEDDGGGNSFPYQCIRGRERYFPGRGFDDDYRPYILFCSKSVDWAEYRRAGNAFP